MITLNLTEEELEIISDAANLVYDIVIQAENYTNKEAIERINKYKFFWTKPTEIPGAEIYAVLSYLFWYKNNYENWYKSNDEEIPINLERQIKNLRNKLLTRINKNYLAELIEIDYSRTVTEIHNQTENVKEKKLGRNYNTIELYPTIKNKIEIKTIYFTETKMLLRGKWGDWIYQEEIR